MNVSNKASTNKQSLLALVELLRSVVQGKCELTSHETLVSSLRSQGALAAFCDESLGICGMSLNTAKRIANESIDGGYAALNRLRLAAGNCIELNARRKDSSNKRTKIGLEKRVMELEQDKERLDNERLLLTRALEISMNQARIYATRSGIPSLIALCKREQQEILAKFEPCFEKSSNVSKIRT